MDVVILAAGENTRLKGICAPHHKPLLVVNGEALIVRLVRQAKSLKPEKIVVVVSSKNAVPIVELLEHQFEMDMLNDKIQFVVQTPGTGIDRALKLGLQMTSLDRVMVLCGDNYMDDENWNILRMAPEVLSRGVIVAQRMTEVASAAFAKIVPISFELQEGPATTSQRWSDMHWHVWLGPIIINGRRTLNNINDVEKNEGRIANLLAIDEPFVYELPVQDIGVPSSLEKRA